MVKSKEIIKKNGNNILKNQDKYYYIGIFKSKAGLLSSSRSKTEAKNDAIKKLEDNFNLNKLDKLTVYRLTIRKVNSEEKKEHKDPNTLLMIGGVLVIIIEQVDIKNNNKLSFKTLDQNIGGNKKIYIDNEYLKKYDHVDPKNLQKLGLKFRRNEIRSFSVNTLTDMIKSF